jgi:hypothetical protein
MIKQKSLIGKEIDTSHHVLEQGKLRLAHTLVKSLKQHESGTSSEEHLPMFLLSSLANMENIHAQLGLNSKHVLLSRESLVSHRKLQLGDKIEVRTFLHDVYEQQASSNPIGFAIIESLGFVKGEIAFYCERVLAVRGGFKRGRS